MTLDNSDAEPSRGEGHLHAFPDSRDTENSDEILADGVYFCEQIFGAIIREVEANVARFAGSQITHHGNLYRRGSRLIKIGKALAQTELCDCSQQFHTPPKPEVYEYLEELIPFFQDIEEPDIASMIEELVVAEVVSEVITILAIRPGRQKSTAVLAAHYGLMSGEDAVSVLDENGIFPEQLDKYLYAAHLDIDEIAHELQYPGDYKAVLELARTYLTG